MSMVKTVARSMLRYKSLLLGSAIITAFIFISIYAVIAIPYDEAVKMWNNLDYWEDNPKLAFPSWVNIFLGRKLPESIVLDSNLVGVKVRQLIPFDGGVYVRIEIPFTYEYDDFPSEIVLRLYVRNVTKASLMKLIWVKPDGTELTVEEGLVGSGYRYYSISADMRFQAWYAKYITEKLGRSPTYDISPEVALFAKEGESILSADTKEVLKGRYRVILIFRSPETSADVDVKLNVYGKVFGMAGTDHKRRDLWLAIIWGAPIALAFGVIASVVTVFLEMIVAAVSAWYGGWVDYLTQRVNEIMLVLPFLPILVMVSYFYRLTIWTLLAIVVMLSIFGSGVKVYRAMFLQIKEMPYVEAARVYGASNFRIIFRYIIPKVLPTAIPAIVLSVPSYVFLEASLAILGVGDPTAITWGRVLEEAFSGGAVYRGYYHWILEPALCLVIMTLGFALIGFTLDKIFNPKLREL
ncbi:MAG: ABC transporter permease [Sulfolobales archaeon]